MARISKVILMVLILACAASHALAGPVLSLSSASVQPGETTTLDLSISGDTDTYAGINARIIIDTDKVQFTGVSAGGGLSAGNFTIDYGTSTVNGYNEVTVIAYSGTSTFSGASGTLLRLNLQVDPNATAGTYTVQFATTNTNALINSMHALSNDDGSISAVHSTQEGSLTIETVGDGDIDDDGIADSWEKTNFGDLITANETTDYDNDGILDKDEYANNTIPTIVTPAVISITPSAGTNSIVVTDIKGSNFQNGATVKLTMSGQQDITATDVAVVNVTHMTSTFNLAGAAAGMWDVKVTLPNGETGTLQDGFTLRVPAGHWKFDEGIGMNATDSSGNGNHGAINGATWTTGKSGGALGFYGVNDYVDLGNPSNLQPGTVSLSAWFKTTATGGMIMRKRLYGYGLEVLPSGNISFWICNSAAKKFLATSPDAYNDNTWHHAVGVYGDSMVKLYIDGFQVASASAGTMYYGTGAIAIGRDGDYNGSYFNGLIDDVCVYNLALTAQEVLDLYNQLSGLVSHWKFDEASGTNAIDSSGNGYNGAINGAMWATGKNGGALSFDGNDYAQIPGLLAQPKDVTISAWANLHEADTGGAELLSLGDHVSLRLDGTGGKGVMGFYYDGTTWHSTPTGLSYVGTGWHHFVYVIDDTNNIQKVYIDGAEKGSTAYTQSISYAGLGSNTVIGKHGNGSGNDDFKGTIDDIQVYNKVLNAHDVLDLYNQVSSVQATAPYAGSIMTVDGNLNELAWDIVTNDVNKKVIGTTNNTTKFGVLWDSTYLYVGMTVLDDTLYDDSTYVWEDDSVEIYIDGDHNHNTTYDNYDRQFVKGWNDSTLFEQHGKTTGVLHGWAPISGGYSIELAIPWSNLGITPTAGMTIGFSVGYNDDDNGEGREGQAIWIGTANNYLDTSAFGEIILGEASTPTPTPAYTPTSTPIPTPSPTPLATLLPTPTPVPLPTAIALPPDLQAFYNFDEGSGASANDSSGNGNHGAINGAIWTAGKSGSALSFDGNDYVQIPGVLGQPQNITISAWANLHGADTWGAELISLGDHVSLRLDGTGGKGAMGFYYDGTTWHVTSTGVSYAGTGWHHFAYVTDDANNIQKVYVDGVEKGSTAYTQSIAYTGLGYNTFIGRHANGGSNTDFNGVIDDVRIYSRALSAQEIQNLYDTFILSGTITLNMVLSNNGVNTMHGPIKAKMKSVNMR